ncbi:MAG TPA: thiamine pyrophosphate-dependent dehydrogenase E1 component subunit alpha [Methylomirabilota bacterium]|nr:thiamine pyrophosphate-dependent dehydrogenase E1 component subunit alpha [Methylomirabilota bacterium]
MSSPPGPDELLQIYAGMLRIRRFEERARELYQAGRIPGFIHLSIGQEAVAVGVCATLRRDDYLLSTHRGHGHFLAKGGSPRALMAELYGRTTGCCKGKGGSMHIADASVGYLGANGVLTSGCVLAPGVGLSIQMRKTDQVVVALFGDGAANRGPFHEGVNLAALWRAPAVFVCENNFWASTTAHEVSTAGGSIAARAAGYGIPGLTVDGNDVLATRAAVAEAVERARQGRGPTLIEARTARLLGHYEGDPQAYRSKGETEAARRGEPIARFSAYLHEAGVLDDAHQRRVAEAIEAEIQEAVDFAESSPWPKPHMALEDLFVHYPWSD